MLLLPLPRRHLIIQQQQQPPSPLARNQTTIQFPLINRSGTLQKLINESTADDGKPSTVHLDDIPGGPDAFELVAKFCYDVGMGLNAANVVLLRCAAEHLHMTQDYGEGNLVELTEAFLRDVLGNWNDSARHLSGLNRHSGYSNIGSRGDASGTVLSDGDQRVLLEEVVLLPAERGVATTRFLLGLLRTAMILHACMAAWHAGTRWRRGSATSWRRRRWRTS